MKNVVGWVGAAVAAVCAISAGPVWAMPSGHVRASSIAEPSESTRMTRAKDFISDEQWVAAIAELRAAVADAKEQNKDEALFWLAHSQNQMGDLAEAVESIRRLQREFQKSRWSAPAYSLLIELAQKLGRHDVLWRMAPPPPPPPPTPQARAAIAAPRLKSPPRVSRPAPPRLPPPPPGVSAAPREPPAYWVAETFVPDKELAIQALGMLIPTDPQKVIPMLGTIALEQDDPGAARRAVFVLAQSRHPEAHHVVVDVAKKGPELVRVAAVRELGLFGGPGVSQELLQVYWTANVPVKVKQQVVMSLGQRSDAGSLLKIAQAENDAALKETVVIALGRAGGREQLRIMYPKGPHVMRRAIIRALFTAQDADGLIRIAEQEKEATLRAYTREQLRLMGTPEAKAYLAKGK